MARNKRNLLLLVWHNGSMRSKASHFVGLGILYIDAGFLLGLFFDLEDGGDMFPRNVG
jgi:hypothetical protein